MNQPRYGGEEHSGTKTSNSQGHTVGGYLAYPMEQSLCMAQDKEGGRR